MKTNLDTVLKELKDKLGTYELPSGIQIIPSFESIKMSKEELYRSYSDSVSLYNKICNNLASLQYTLVTIDRILHVLPNSNEVFSRQKFFNSEYSNLKSDYRLMIDSYKSLKDGLEQVVKFYSSVQFILNSPRLDV